MDTDFKRLYEDLMPIIDEELRAQLAIGRLGEIPMPSREQISTVASLIADEVVRYLERQTRVTN
jgi:hypothetical protein